MICELDSEARTDEHRLNKSFSAAWNDLEIEVFEILADTSEMFICLTNGAAYVCFVFRFSFACTV